PKDLPPQPRFAEGWRLGQPDIVIDIGQDFQVPPGLDRYEYFTVPTNFKEGMWIRAAEVHPGNRQVVHHVHVYIVEEESHRAVAEPNPAKGPIKSIKDIMQEENGLSLVRDDAPVVDDACSSDVSGLPNLTGGQEGSFTAFLPGRQPDVFPAGTAKWVPPGA